MADGKLRVGVVGAGVMGSCYVTALAEYRRAELAAVCDLDVDRARDLGLIYGAEIVGYLKTGSAYYAPGAAAVEMVESIVKNKRRVLPCATWLQGEYDLTDVYVGVPVLLGTGGIEKVVEVQLSDKEKEMLHSSANHVKAVMAKLDI